MESSPLLLYVHEHSGRIAAPQEGAADVVFFHVTRRGEPDAATFRRLSRAHAGDMITCDPLDGQEHGFMQLGGWLGDQALALQYMGLGALLGVFELLTPDLLPGLSAAERLELARAGMVAVAAKQGDAAPSVVVGFEPAAPAAPGEREQHGR